LARDETNPGEDTSHDASPGVSDAQETSGRFQEFRQQDRGPLSTVLNAPPITEKPGDKIGRYKLLEQIGEGGFGVVYMAEQKEPLKRRVALKIIKLGMDTRQVVARFEAERQALALMDHLNIAKVLDAGSTETGRPYFVMELVHGIRITDYCDQHHLSTRQRLELFMEVCHAIQHAHQKGIIHRDIKPSNILVTLHDGVPVPKVIDFGIAKATAGQELTEKTMFTQFQQFIGTPAYMSPEQAEMSGLDIDTRSDIYSLGVLLYELLVGRTPFDSKELLAAGLEEMRRTIREKEPVRPSTRVSSMLGEELTTTAKRRGSDAPKLVNLLRGDLDWIAMKCLEKDRTRRYETANGLARDIERHLNNEPVVARPPSHVYRFQKLVRRNKLAFAAGGAVAAALVIGLGISIWLFIREAKAEREQSRLRVAAESAQEKESEQRRSAEKARDETRHLLYIDELNLVQQAWEQNNIGRMKALLKETASAPERGFEWYYWQRQIHRELKTFYGHLGPVACAAFSPNGQQIITGSFDETAKVWDVGSGRLLHSLQPRGAGACVAFSPDGQRIVSGNGGGTKVWETGSGKLLLTYKGHGGGVGGVAFSPDSRRIVTGHGDGVATVWEAASGQILRTLAGGHSGPILCVAFSPDGRRIVTGGSDHLAIVWDAASARKMLAFTNHTGQVRSVAFSPDGQRIVTGSWDRTTRVWDATDGRELLAPIKGHSGPVMAAAFSADGQRLITGSGDQTAKVWDANDGNELMTLRGHSSWVWSAAFSSDDHRILTSSWDKTAKVWGSDAGLESIRFKGHTNWVWSVAFSPDSERLLTYSSDGTARIWEAHSGQEIRRIRGHANRSDWFGCAAFAPDGQRIAMTTADQTAKVFDADSGAERLTLNGDTGEVTTLAYSPDGQRIVTGSTDSIAIVWDAASGEPLIKLAGHRGGIMRVAVSPDSRRIVTASTDGTAKVWEAATGHLELTFKKHDGELICAAFSPDGRRIVTGSTDETARVWDATSGKVLVVFTGHSAFIRSAAFSPDGQRIVTGSFDQTAKVWEASSGQELLTLRAQGALIDCVAFSPDGRRIALGCDDNTASVWEAASPEQVAGWIQEERAGAEAVTQQEKYRAALPERDRAARARVPGGIKQWLVLLPIPIKSGNGAQALEDEQVVQESQLRPVTGQRSKAGKDELIWRAVQQDDFLLDFNQLAGGVTPSSVTLAVSYLHSETAQTNLVLRVGSDDEARVYLNGKRVYQWESSRSYDPDEDVVAGVELKAGLNVLVFKVVNETAVWQGSVRLTDAAGHAVKGLRVSLAP
jgi:WD40 repeat protein/serine/threonine protein kinase